MDFFDDVYELVGSALVAGSSEVPGVVAVFPSTIIWILLGMGAEDETSALNPSPAIAWRRDIVFSGPLLGYLRVEISGSVKEDLRQWGINFGGHQWLCIAMKGGSPGPSKGCYAWVAELEGQAMGGA